MCLAMPGRIVSVEDDNATIQYPAETRSAKLISDDFKVGDYVFVQAGIVLDKISKKEAEESLEAWSNLK